VPASALANAARGNISATRRKGIAAADYVKNHIKRMCCAQQSVKVFRRRTSCRITTSGRLHGRHSKTGILEFSRSSNGHRTAKNGDKLTQNKETDWHIFRAILSQRQTREQRKITQTVDYQE